MMYGQSKPGFISDLLGTLFIPFWPFYLLAALAGLAWWIL